MPHQLPNPSPHPSLPSLPAEVSGRESARHAPPALPVPPRPSVISQTIHDREALYLAYMPFLRNGGLFVPCHRDSELGDEVFLLLSLPDDEQRYPLAGTIAWITPPGSTRIEGIGVHFPADESGLRLRRRIEDILGTLLGSDRPTHTL